MTESKPIPLILGDNDPNYKPILVCTDSCYLDLTKYSNMMRMIKDLNISINNKQIIIDLNVDIKKATVDFIQFGNEVYYLKQIIIQKSNRFVNYREYPLEINLIHLAKNGNYLIIQVFLSPNSNDMLTKNIMIEKMFVDEEFWKDREKMSIGVLIRDNSKKYLRLYGNTEISFDSFLPIKKLVSFETYEFTNKFKTKTRMVILNTVCNVSCDFLQAFAKNVIGMPSEEYEQSEWGKYCNGGEIDQLPKQVKYNGMNEIKIERGNTIFIEKFDLQKGSSGILVKEEELLSEKRIYGLNILLAIIVAIKAISSIFMTTFLGQLSKKIILGLFELLFIILLVLVFQNVQRRFMLFVIIILLLTEYYFVEGRLPAIENDMPYLLLTLVIVAISLILVSYSAKSDTILLILYILCICIFFWYLISFFLFVKKKK